jgi:3-deoxy-D-manno-octulosonic-acid transferase/heptosyltransferase-1
VSRVDLPRRVLLVRLSALGDCVHVLPALDALRRGLGPQAHLAWLVEEKAASLLAGHPELDRVLVLPRAAATELVRARRPIAALRRLSGFLGELRAERFDATIDFQGNLRSGLAALATGARLRVGFARGYCKESSHLLRNRNVAPASRRMHKVEKNLALVAALGIDTKEARPHLRLPGEARTRAAALFAEQFPGHGPVVALHPGVSRFASFTQWAPERYAAVADALARGRAARSLVTWGPGERPLAEAVVAAAAPETGAVVAPETASILELAAIYERCAAVVGCDTGPVHLAAALGVPVVSLYGPKDPAIYAPWSAREQRAADAIWKQVHCSPCTLRWCGNVICMEAIQAADVEAAVERVLSGAEV